MTRHRELEHRIGVWNVLRRLQGRETHKVLTSCESCGAEKPQILQHLRNKPTHCKACGAGRETVPKSHVLDIWELASSSERWFIRGATLDDALRRLNPETRDALLAQELSATRVVLGPCSAPKPLDMEPLRETWKLRELTRDEMFPSPLPPLPPEEPEELPDDIDQQDLPPNAIKVRPKFLPFVTEGHPMQVPYYVKEFLACLGDTRLMEIDVSPINDNETLVTFHARQIKQIVASFDLD